MRQSLSNGRKGTFNEDVIFCQFKVCGDTTRMQYVCACMPMCVCSSMGRCAGPRICLQSPEVDSECLCQLSFT